MAEVRPQHRGGTLQRSWGLLAGAAVAVLLLWRILTDSPKWHELCVGLVATGLTTLFLARIVQTETLKLTFRLRDLVQLWRIPWYILSACWEITSLLFKDLAGQPTGSFFQDCGFKTSKHDPLLVARSVLAITYTTTSPNFIVIGIDPKQSLMLFHQLKHSNVPKMTQALGARP